VATVVETRIGARDATAAIETTGIVGRAGVEVIAVRVAVKLAEEDRAVNEVASSRGGASEATPAATRAKNPDPLGKVLRRKSEARWPTRKGPPREKSARSASSCSERLSG
jgi:hypothetical protein